MRNNAANPRGLRRALAALVACMLAIIMSSQQAAGQATSELFVDPPTQQVGGGSTFNVRVLQNASVVTLGAQTTVVFNPALLQIIDVQPGAPYAGSQLITAGPLDVVIAEANDTGRLRCVATFLIPGTASVDPGEQEFLSITMQASAGAIGTSPIELSDEACGSGTEGSQGLIDEAGEKVVARATGGSVSLDPSAPVTQVTPEPTPADGLTPGTVASPASAGTPISTVAGTTNRPIVGSVSYAIAPATLSVGKGEQFSLEVKLNANVKVKTGEVDLTFDPDVLDLESIEPGSSWQGATGASASDLAAKVEQANSDGKLANLGFILSGSKTVQAGEQLFVTLHMRGANKDGASDVQITSINLSDENGDPISGASASSSGSGADSPSRITVGSGAGGGGGARWLLIAGIGAGLVAVGGTGAYVIRRRRAWA